MNEESKDSESIEETGIQEILVHVAERNNGETEGIQEVFAASTAATDESPSIVAETLQVIAENENKDSESLTSVYERTGTEDNVIDSLEGKQVFIVAAQNSEDNIINMSKDGKQFLIVAGPDSASVPLNIGTLEELTGQDTGEPATKRVKIQGGQSFVLTMSADSPVDSVLQLQGADAKKRTITGGVKSAEKKSQLLQSDVSQAWFTSRDDKNMLQNSGASWRQGQWTKDEVDLLQINISDYCKQHGISDPTEIIFEMSKDERKQFYRTIARGLQRPLFSVYRRVIRMYDQKNHIGKYTAEEMVNLRELRKKHGNDWALIGQALGRSASSVKDKCRLMRDTCNSGKWLPDEERRLTDAVYEFSGSQPDCGDLIGPPSPGGSVKYPQSILTQKSDYTNFRIKFSRYLASGENVVQGLSWSLVAEKVITRSEKQCRTKWLNYLNWKQKGGTEWTREDDMNLILRVVNLGVSNDSEIDWNELSKDWKSVRSPQWLRGKWWSLKRHIPDYQLLPYNQLLEYMKTFYLNCRVRPVTGSRSVKSDSTADSALTYLPINLPGFQSVDSSLEDGVPAVQAYEVLQQLPEVTGSFVITQPNSSVVQSGLSEHIIVQALPVSQQSSDDDSEVQSHVIITSPGSTDALNGTVSAESPGLNGTITLTHEHDLHELTEENVMPQTDSLSEDNSTFDTATLVGQSIGEAHDIVISIKSEAESPVLLAPRYVPSGSSDGDLMTSFSDPMLNSDSNSMMETASDMESDKNNDIIVTI